MRVRAASDAGVGISGHNTQHIHAYNKYHDDDSSMLHDILYI